MAVSSSSPAIIFAVTVLMLLTASSVDKAHSWTCMDIYVFVTPYRVTWDWYFISREHTMEFNEWEGKVEYDYVKQKGVSIFLMEAGMVGTPSIHMGANFDARPHPWVTNITTDEIHSGDLLAISKIRGRWDSDGKLWVGESGNENEKGEDVIAEEMNVFIQNSNFLIDMGIWLDTPYFDYGSFVVVEEEEGHTKAQSPVPGLVVKTIPSPAKKHDLSVLGSGFEVITIGKKKLVRSVPTELNKDHNQILELAQGQGFVTVEQVRRRLSWTSGRVIDALETLLEEGLAMIDNGIKDGKCQYWFPCVSSVYSFVGSDT
ncbi:hypothetical protein HID58_041923 [Brassica napus]|uniref:Uncharacterized protein n=1 Tax=Brassica napus TaxID=3708 RepID=A0ABQ8BC77_BRANA|nr:hypothetical protein HID58_041923 [Brassica napus]